MVNAIQSISHFYLIEFHFHLPESTCIISIPSCKHSIRQPPPFVMSDNQDLQPAVLHLHLQALYVQRPTLPKTHIPRAVLHSTRTSGAHHPLHRCQPVARGCYVTHSDNSERSIRKTSYTRACSGSRCPKNGVCGSLTRLPSRRFGIRWGMWVENVVSRKVVYTGSISSCSCEHPQVRIYSEALAYY